MTDDEFVNYIPSEEESKNILEKISQLQNESTKVVTINEAKIDEDLIRLQQEKKKQISNLISPLMNSVDPEILSAIQQSLSFISTQENIEEIESKSVSKSEFESKSDAKSEPKVDSDAKSEPKVESDAKSESDMEEMIKIEMQKQQNIKQIMGPLKDVIPPELLETVNMSLKEMAKSESLSIANNKETEVKIVQQGKVSLISIDNKAKEFQTEEFESNSDTKAVSKSEFESKSDPKSERKLQSDAKIDAKSNAKSDSKPEPKLESDTKSESRSRSESESSSRSSPTKETKKKSKVQKFVKGMKNLFKSSESSDSSRKSSVAELVGGMKNISEALISKEDHECATSKNNLHESDVTTHEELPRQEITTKIHLSSNYPGELKEEASEEEEERKNSAMLLIDSMKDISQKIILENQKDDEKSSSSLLSEIDAELREDKNLKGTK